VLQNQLSSNGESSVKKKKKVQVSSDDDSDVMIFCEQVDELEKSLKPTSDVETTVTSPFEPLTDDDGDDNDEVIVAVSNIPDF